MTFWELGESIGHPGNKLALYKIECAFCHERGNWELVFHQKKRKPNTDKQLNFDVYKCGNCAGYVHVVWSAKEMPTSFEGMHDFRILPWPEQAKPDAPEHWPETLRRFWAQAHQSKNAEIWDGASVMARSAMQVALRGQGATGSTLRDEINTLSSAGMLPPIMKEWATELRILGNEAAHPEIDQTNPNPQDIRDAIHFLDLLLYYLYDLPHQIQEYRARRTQQ